MYTEEQAHYVKGSPYRPMLYFYLLSTMFYFSHQPFIPIKGYLGIVGADRATATPGAVRGTVLRGWKQVMPLLL